ncbi:type IV toxin-antitoxin system AbiEi family antitoxin [Bosea sp. (in: a-proteobacteria)]|jgi:hypothetical protein|uniref:type IV toxin-antitoxin system AbiEi family antitoxin n=1 Tax=Bosea sp. (in: a-proteobacteria) TaxID=1871050 RepID=UPI0025B857CE|nr:type IV toxin-antitoxin system AbiEi family antitoxin [Bosea sp. (in: a-proteobacteria)]
MFGVDERRRQPLNHLLASLSPGLLVDSAWLQGQGISRASIHDYVKRGWLERVAPRVYRRATQNGTASTVRWDMAVMSAQRIGTTLFHVGGVTALDLLGQGHFARLGSARLIHLYGSEGAAPSWLGKLQTDATIRLHTRAMFTDAALGVAWHRLDLGTGRLGVAVTSPDSTETWDHFLRVAGAERAAIEMMEDVPDVVGFEHADMIFENLATLRPRLLTSLLETCQSVRAKRLFLFFADRHDHGWIKHVDRSGIDLGRGKRQLVPGGRLDPVYQITVPPTLLSRVGATTQ